MTIDTLLKNEEGQVFDRKSVMIEPKTLAISVVAFANADGGKIAIGISDKTKRIEGVDFDIDRVNELLRVPFDFCNPTVKIEVERVPCIDYKGRRNHVVVMHIEPSPHVHANQADEVFFRIGDKSRLLKFEDRLQLTYDKGERYFEDKLVPDVTVEDLDMEQVEEYVRRIGYGKEPMEFLVQNNGFVVEKAGKLQVSTAALLLFGKKPQNYFPRARVRFIKYEGTEEKFGAEMNVVKDVVFKGTILRMIQDSIAYLDTQIKEKTYLGPHGIFITEEEYPKFVRQEIIVNAVTHRAYSITGTDIQVKMFDDRIVVESPGKLPGMVRAENIRFTHFSRNPKIAEFLKAYDFVKEYGEGVDRMCKELEAVGQKKPEYHTNAFMLQTIVYNSKNPTIQNKDLAIQSRNPAICDEDPAIHSANMTIRDGNSTIYKGNPAIRGQNPAIWDGNPTIYNRNSAIHSRNSAIQDEDLADYSRNSVIHNEKLKETAIEIAIKKQKYIKKTRENLLAVYNSIDTNQAFGAPDVKKILNCTNTASKDIMKKLRTMDVLIEIKGKGKGKYRFAYEGERPSKKT